MDQLLFSALALFVYMTILWAIGLFVRNAGLVDIGWPTGFVGIAIYFGATGEGYGIRKAIIVSLFFICGARFTIGWIIRNIRDGEDKRWQLWRERWKRGDSLFSIKSIPFNLFLFYHAQTIATAFVLITPVVIACKNESRMISLVEWVAVFVWFVSFFLENVADIQLDRFRRRGNQGVCRDGLWNYSRHPNYFFEFCIWCAYSIFALASVESAFDLLIISLVPVTAYWFLVYYTGIPVTEKASLLKRGEAYQKYQSEVNRFFPMMNRRKIK
ncbi:DUF1295 domain-containing protein [Pirellulaceae bacterium]|nr:DUF1295 domain-containing protein [Pirellulaceae bacterium]